MAIKEGRRLGRRCSAECVCVRKPKADSNAPHGDAEAPCARMLDRPLTGSPTSLAWATLGKGLSHLGFSEASVGAARQLGWP
jgi:hypothetical protein